MHIVICGELGAGCTELGQILSERLGLNVINSASIIKGIVVDFRGVHPEESFGEFERHVLSGEVDLDRMLASKIDEFLEQGDTIIEGRSAFMLLNREGVLKVLLVATQNIRVNHIMKRRKISKEEAEDMIQKSDNERKHMVEVMFKRDWLDPHNYGIVINTSVQTIEEAADLILKVLESLPQ